MFFLQALSFDLILWTRFLDGMKGFAWFVSQVLYPVSVAAAAVPPVLALWMLGRLPPQNLQFPVKYFCLLALLGTGMNWGMSISGSLLDASFQVRIRPAALVVLTDMHIMMYI